jgi:DNA processing protein
LIRQGAKLVETVADVLEELRLDTAAVSAAAGPSAEDADPSEHRLLRDMGYDPVSLDALCARTGFSAAELQAQLLELELAGSVARLPGGLFQRIAQG